VQIQANRLKCTWGCLVAFFLNAGRRLAKRMEHRKLVDTDLFINLDHLKT